MLSPLGPALQFGGGSSVITVLSFTAWSYLHNDTLDNTNEKIIHGIVPSISVENFPILL